MNCEHLPSSDPPQFDTPRDILCTHWQHNGSPVQTRSIQLVNVAARQVLPSVAPPPSQPAPQRPRARLATRPQPMFEEDEVPDAPTPRPLEEESILTLAIPDPMLPAWGRKQYPRAWQDFIDHAQTYFLNNMIYAHPFCSGPEFELWARETVATAFLTFPPYCSSTYKLCKKSCKSFLPPSKLSSLTSPASVNEHRSNIVSLVRQWSTPPETS